MPLGEELLAFEAARDPATPRAELLDQLVSLEILAQRAELEGLAADPTALEHRRQALARAYLRHVFEREVTPEGIPEAQVAELFKMPKIRKLFDHPADAWRMAHLYIQACDPIAEDCTKPTIQAYFDNAEAVMRELWAELGPRAEPLAPDAERVQQLLKDYHVELAERLPQVMYEDFSFYYDPRKPHHEQKGYAVVAEGVARTVIDAPRGVLQAPVRSTFGWHIILKLEHQPERHMSADDPEVIAEIRKNAFPAFQTAAFKRRMADLRARYEVEITAAPLGALGPGLD